MFDMNKIGFKLVELRKRLDYTQVEVADKLGVSYQAVSNWERGLSMPDISKLPEIAEMYKITLDELFGKRISNVVMSAKNNDLKELLENKPLSVKEVEEISSIARPSQIEEISKSIPEVEEVEESMLGLLPFVTTEVADKIVANLIETEDVMDLIDSSAPFISKELITKLVDDAINKGNSVEEMLNVIVFVDKQAADSIVTSLLEVGHDAGDLLDRVAPFISTEIVDEVVIKIAESGMGLEKVAHYAPFISREVLSKIIEGKL